MDGSRRSPTGSATVPARTSSPKLPSLKFCENHVARTTIHSRPDALTTSSARSASSSPPPDSRTNRETPGVLGLVGELGNDVAGAGDGQGGRPRLRVVPIERDVRRT